jgi:hypothetical protein
MGYLGYTTSQLKKMVIKHGNKTGRQELVDQYGFDVKFASHAFRLARQGCEILLNNNITFPRPDREFLKAIRTGEIYNSDSIEKCCNDLEREISLLKEAYEKTILPPKVDFQLLNNLLINVYDEYVHNGDPIV